MFSFHIYLTVFFFNMLIITKMAQLSEGIVALDFSATKCFTAFQRFKHYMTLNIPNMKSKKKHEVSDSDTSIDTKISSPKLKASPSKNSPLKQNHSDSDNEDIQKTDSDNDFINGNSETDEKVNVFPKKRDRDSSENVSSTAKSIFDVDELTSDDEIYTFQCPDNYNKHELINKTLDFSNSTKIYNSKSNEELQVEVIPAEKKFITLAVPSKNRNGCLINLPLNGHIVIEKVSNMADSEIPVEEELEDIKFPDDLVMRHPLLGADWKSHIDKANDALKMVKKKRKKEKKEKKLKEVSEIEDRKIKRSPSIVDSPIKKKKKK